MSQTPTPAPALALTGVTGQLGGRVARLLAERGLALRLLARAPERVAVPDGSVARPLSFGDDAQAAEALAGVETLFFVSAAEHVDRRAQHLALVAAAAAAGVRHVVYTSFLGAGPDAVFTLGRDHGATEQAVRESGMAWTFLRDNFYADFLPERAGEDGAIRGPAGTGAVSAVARDDVADVAAVVLAEPHAHAGRTYDLTGPEALTLAEVAARIERVTGRPTRYVDETLPEAYASRAGYGAPDWQVEAWVSTYTAIATGDLAAVSDAVPRLTGHPARSLDDLLRGS